MAKRLSLKLEDALRDKLLVKFTRTVESGSGIGYVMDIGPRFFLVALVSDEIWFNGFQCLKTSDVKELDVPHTYAAFVELALRNRGERMPRKPRVNLASLEDLLASAGRGFGLVTINRERVDPGVCQIGRVISIGKGRVELLEISPDATWNEKPNSYRLSEITRVDFGGDYENALELVSRRILSNQLI